MDSRSRTTVAPAGAGTIVRHFVIGLAGLGGAGKGEVQAMLLSRRPGVTVHLRTIVEEELRRQGRAATNESLRAEATRLRAEEGPDAIAKRALPQVRAGVEHYPVVVIDSIKSIDEVRAFRAGLPDRLVVLAVVASPDVRFARLASRGLPWDMRDRSAFDWRDRVEASWGAADAVAAADYTIRNDATRHDLELRVDEFLAWLDRGTPPPRGP
ncbi:MAG TPA: hypothetical protein VFF67_06770 [Thermoplasmata archaeon]|nr:hypothetical protein [Thermoplasmata archaeon]